MRKRVEEKRATIFLRTRSVGKKQEQQKIQLQSEIVCVCVRERK